MSKPGVENKRISRRSFLKLAGVGFGALLLRDIGLDAWLSSATYGSELEIPPEFANVPIPERNENYRAPENILLEAFDIYDEGRKEAKLPRIRWEKGPEYLNVANLAKRFPGLLERIKSGDSDQGAIDYSMKLYEMLTNTSDDKSIVENADVPQIFAFSSAVRLWNVGDMIIKNPGSSIITEAEEYLCTKYGWTRSQLLSALIRYDDKLPIVSDEDWDKATQICSDRLHQALTYCEQRRANKGSPISIAEPLAYFLYQNKGDLKKSMWDLTFSLKVWVRNNIDTLGPSATFKQAEKMADLFLDEFSPHISHNWLMEKYRQGIVPSDSSLYLEDEYSKLDNKTFMPINTDGTYYHVMNIMTWSAVSMEPWLVKSLVGAYYNQSQLGGYAHRLQQHGSEKVEADILVAKAAGRIKRIVDWQT